jgi:hypothetical protein
VGGVKGVGTEGEEVGGGRVGDGYRAEGKEGASVYIHARTCTHTHARSRALSLTLSHARTAHTHARARTHPHQFPFLVALAGRQEHTDDQVRQKVARRVCRVFTGWPGRGGEERGGGEGLGVGRIEDRMCRHCLCLLYSVYGNSSLYYIIYILFIGIHLSIILYI